MSIQAAELVLRAPANISNGASNGGRMTSTAITPGVKNNVWPDVPQSERTAGSTLYRKVFLHVANDDDLTLVQPRVYIETPTAGDDTVTFFPGTQTDTQANITGSERRYGGGKLNADAALGASSITVLVEKAADQVIRSGDRIRISDKASVGAGTGNEQLVTVSGTVTYAGSVATVPLASPLQYAFLAATTRVASLYEPGDIKGSIANLTKTSVAGTFDSANNPPAVDAIAGVEQNWTLTFTSSTQFTCVGDTVGSVGTGNVSSSFQPTNPAYSKPYFVLPSAAWGGTYQTGDTLTFTTHPAALAIWMKREIPAGANSLTGNSVIVALEGESA